MARPPDSSRAVARRLSGAEIPRVVLDVAPLVALGVLFLSSDARFSFLDEEATALSDAVRPVGALFAAFRLDAQRPPLYPLLLHLWLMATGGAPALLHVLPMVFFLLGVWALSRAALRMAGDQSGTSMIWLAALWPFGFHTARLANGYSFGFLLIAALTWAYLRDAASPSRQGGALVCALIVLLVWTTYFAWVLLALLAFEECFRNRNDLGQALKRVAIAAAVLAAASFPVWRVLPRAASNATGSHLPVRGAIVNAGYNLYLLMVSESVAPWYWKFGAPAMLAVAAGLFLTVLATRGQAFRFLLYGIIALVLLATSRSLSPEVLLLAAPWFLLPAAVAVGTTHTSLWRRSMAVSLAVIAGVGWYGVVARVYYAEPRYVEPWGVLAVEAGTAVRDGGAVIANDPALFLYLTYALRVPDSTPWRFTGILPSTVHYPQVWGPEDWQAAGDPLRPTVLWIAGTPQSDSMMKAGDWLDHNCGDRTERRLARDSGFAFRERFLGQSGATPWLIELRQYSCGPNGAGPASPPQ